MVKRLINILARELHVKPLKMLFLLILTLDVIVGIFDFHLVFKLTILAIIGCIFTYAVNIPLKTLFKTKRPRMDEYQDMEYGFPSFHAQTAFTIATIYSFYFSSLFIPTFIFATFVGVSRLITKAHKFIDVFFGSILGVLIGAVLLLL